MEDYGSKSEEYYEICKLADIKRVSPPPNLYLENAYCDIAKKGNVFRYKLLLDEDIPLIASPITSTVVQPPSATSATGSGGSRSISGSNVS
jgi:hypothetical protein